MLGRPAAADLNPGGCCEQSLRGLSSWYRETRTQNTLQTVRTSQGTQSWVRVFVRHPEPTQADKPIGPRPLKSPRSDSIPAGIKSGIARTSFVASATPEPRVWRHRRTSSMRVVGLGRGGPLDDWSPRGPDRPRGTPPSSNEQGPAAPSPGRCHQFLSQGGRAGGCPRPRDRDRLSGKPAPMRHHEHGRRGVDLSAPPRGSGLASSRAPPHPEVRAAQACSRRALSSPSGIEPPISSSRISQSWSTGLAPRS